MNTKESLLKHLENVTGVLRDKNIQQAFARVDRRDFVPDELRDEAYEDYPLPIGYGQTISQPTTVAFMLEKVAARPGDKVLDVGSGSGWTTALLAHIVGPKGRVYGVELVPLLVQMGQKNLSKYDLTNALIEPTGASLGLPSEAPFDRILVSAAASGEVPEKLVSQLKEGGKMMIPVDDAIMEVIKENNGTITQKKHHGFVFVPLVEQKAG